MLIWNFDAQQNPDTETPEILQFYLYQLQQKPQFKKKYNITILNNEYRTQIVIASSQKYNTLCILMFYTSCTESLMMACSEGRNM